MKSNIEEALEKQAFQMVRHKFPDELKDTFELHVHASYSAQEYTYILQHLSEILLSIGCGVLGNIIYQNIVPSKQCTKEDLESMILQYECKIDALRTELENSQIVLLETGDDESKLKFKNCESLEKEEIAECEYHDKMLQELKDNDPFVVFEVEKAIKQLNERIK